VISTADPYGRNLGFLDRRRRILFWFIKYQVRERTIPTERLLLVDDISTNFCGERVPRGQRDESLLPYSRISRPEPLFFLTSISSFVLTRLSGPRFRLTTSQKIW
jgi:hypothetical protein